MTLDEPAIQEFKSCSTLALGKPTFITGASSSYLIEAFLSNLSSMPSTLRPKSLFHSIPKLVKIKVEVWALLNLEALIRETFHAT